MGPLAFNGTILIHSSVAEWSERKSSPTGLLTHYLNDSVFTFSVETFLDAIPRFIITQLSEIAEGVVATQGFWLANVSEADVLDSAGVVLWLCWFVVRLSLKCVFETVWGAVNSELMSLWVWEMLEVNTIMNREMRRIMETSRIDYIWVYLWSFYIFCGREWV